MAKHSPYFERRHLWRERLIAILALINLGLVLFDLSYLYGRDFYRQTIPGLVQLYDPIKGIEPHSETENYLKRVETLEAKLGESELRAPSIENELEQMRQLSLQIIEDDPFAAANKSHTLEKIKEQLRQRTGKPFARDAWMTFWSSAYLDAGWQQELAFWEQQIQPLIASNYSRNIGRFGNFINYFWLIDLPFVIIFAIDLIARITSIKRRHHELTWFEAILRRWYDLFLLLPFWRLWRILPISIRLYHVNFLNLEPVRAEIQRDLLISLAAELTEMVGVKVIEQMQHSILTREALQGLFEPKNRQPYLDVNGKNEVQSITNRLLQVSVYDVIPQVQPDIEALVRHSISSTLKQIPLYQELQNVPGFNRLPAQISNNLAKTLSRIAYNNLTNVLEDPVAAEITTRLSNNFREAFERELFQKQNIQEIKSLFVDLLEEIKINYIKGIEEVGIEQLMDDAERLKYKVDAYAKI